MTATSKYTPEPIASVQPQPLWTDAELIRDLINTNSPVLYLGLVLAILLSVAYIVRLAKQE